MLEQDDLTPVAFIQDPEESADPDQDCSVLTDSEDTQTTDDRPRRGGRPPKPIDRETVIKLARLHITQEDIARWFGVNHNVIKERFGEDIHLAQAETRARLRRKMLEQALAGNSTMLIWLGKNMCNMSDNGPIDSDDNKPLPWTDD